MQITGHLTPETLYMEKFRKNFGALEGLQRISLTTRDHDVVSITGGCIRIRSKLAMVFKNFHLWSHLTLLEDVMEALRWMRESATHFTSVLRHDHRNE